MTDVEEKVAPLELLLDMELPVSISFGRSHILLQDLVKLAAGSVVELNRGAADPVDVIVSGQVIAQGEAIRVNGNYGVRILRVAGRDQRLQGVNSAVRRIESVEPS